MTRKVITQNRIQTLRVDDQLEYIAGKNEHFIHAIVAVAQLPKTDKISVCFTKIIEKGGLVTHFVGEVIPVQYSNLYTNDWVLPIFRHDREMKGDACPSCQGSGTTTEKLGPLTFRMDCVKCWGTGIINSPNACCICNGRGSIPGSRNGVCQPVLCTDCRGSGLTGHSLYYKQLNGIYQFRPSTTIQRAIITAIALATVIGTQVTFDWGTFTVTVTSNSDPELIFRDCMLANNRE